MQVRSRRRQPVDQADPRRPVQRSVLARQRVGAEGGGVERQQRHECAMKQSPPDEGGPQRDANGGSPPGLLHVGLNLSSLAP